VFRATSGPTKCRCAHRLDLLLALSVDSGRLVDCLKAISAVEYGATNTKLGFQETPVVPNRHLTNIDQQIQEIMRLRDELRAAGRALAAMRGRVTVTPRTAIKPATLAAPLRNDPQTSKAGQTASTAIGVPVVALIDASPVAPISREAFLKELAALLGDPVSSAVIYGCPPPASLPGLCTFDASWQAACARAFAIATARGAHLLVKRGGVVSRDSVAALVCTLESDPMFGIVHPRYRNEDGRLYSLTDELHLEPSTVSTYVLEHVPDVYFVPELVSPCLLVRRDLVVNLTPASGTWRELTGLLTEYAVRARRLGFRSIVSNRVVVSLTSRKVAALEPNPADLGRIRAEFPDAVTGSLFLRTRENAEAEQRIACLIESPRSLLIDARNLNPIVNGTSKAILGLTDGLRRVRGGFPATIWVQPSAADYHQISARFPGWEIETGPRPTRCFAAALRLSQPWGITEVFDLHKAAAVCTFLMLDSIAWDVLYTAPPALDTVWRLAANTADGLVFISEFSRQRFVRRFPPATGVETAVVHLSLDPRDYVDGDTATHEASSERFWFVVGNTYDHKHVTPTLDLLCGAFPTRTFVALGDRAARRWSRVRHLQSGATDESVMQAHYARAEVIIFPSFYEGFGLPIINALAYGRTVLARDSDLVRELAGRYRGPGRLLVFDSETSLVDRLARLAHGREVPELPLASDSDWPIHGWTEAAAQIDRFLQQLVSGGLSSQLRQMRSLTAAVVSVSA